MSILAPDDVSRISGLSLGLPYVLSFSEIQHNHCTYNTTPAKSCTALGEWPDRETAALINGEVDENSKYSDVGIGRQDAI